MQLEFKNGNIFDSDAMALINPVNTDGIMGKGLAYQFKKIFPENFEKYRKVCENKKLNIGTDLLIISENGKIIINFPTKTTWRLPSKIDYIKIGLKKLKELLIKENIKSVAIPPLGSGNGGLDWREVKKELILFVEELQEYDIKIDIYEPNEDENNLTNSHLLILKAIMLSYEYGISKEWISDFIFQNIIYFSDKFMQRDYFNYSKSSRGLFSETTNKLYDDLKEHINTKKIKFKELESILEKKYVSNQLKKEELSLLKSIELIKMLKMKFCSKNKEELENKVELVSVLVYIIDKKNNITEKDIYEEFKNWSLRKRGVYSYGDIENMLIILKNEKIVSSDLFGNIRLSMKI